jgi:hypothetical protein
VILHEDLAVIERAKQVASDWLAGMGLLEDISLEAVVLQVPWRELFTPEELATAQRRLRNAGLSHLIP